MTIESENLGNGSGKAERFGGKYRGARRNTPLAEESSPGDALGQRDPGTPGLELVDTQATATSLPVLDLGGLSEPVFPASSWSDPPPESLADHPLLRGLLFELPPKGAMPAPEWLDRWFEAARSILELLYVQDARRSR